MRPPWTAGVPKMQEHFSAQRLKFSDHDSLNHLIAAKAAPTNFRPQIPKQIEYLFLDHQHHHYDDGGEYQHAGNVLGVRISTAPT